MKQLYIPGGEFSTSQFLKVNRIRKWDWTTYREAEDYLRSKGCTEIRKNNGVYWVKPGKLTVIG